MALVKYYIGTLGPFYFDPIKDMPRQVGVSQAAFRTPGPIVITGTPTDPDHSIRLEDLTAVFQLVQVIDIDSPVELALLTGVNEGSIIIAFMQADPTEFTIYSWDPSVTLDDSPFVVKSGSGGWVSIAGKHNSQSYFWEDLPTGLVGFKLKRSNKWVYWKLNSTLNGLSIHKIENA